MSLELLHSAPEKAIRILEGAVPQFEFFPGGELSCPEIPLRWRASPFETCVHIALPSSPAGTHPGLRPPLPGRVMRIAASADEEGGEGQGGPVEEAVEPVAKIDGGELGRQARQ